MRICYRTRGAHNYRNKGAVPDITLGFLPSYSKPMFYMYVWSTCVPGDVIGRWALSDASGRGQRSARGPFALRAELSSHYYIDNEIWRYCAFYRRPRARSVSPSFPLSRIKTAARPPATSVSRYYCGTRIYSTACGLARICHPEAWQDI